MWRETRPPFIGQHRVDPVGTGPVGGKGESPQQLPQFGQGVVRDAIGEEGHGSGTEKIVTSLSPEEHDVARDLDGPQQMVRHGHPIQRSRGHIVDGKEGPGRICSRPRQSPTGLVHRQRGDHGTRRSRDIGENPGVKIEEGQFRRLRGPGNGWFAHHQPVAKQRIPAASGRLGADTFPGGIDIVGEKEIASVRLMLAPYHPRVVQTQRRAPSPSPFV